MTPQPSSPQLISDILDRAAERLIEPDVWAQVPNEENPDPAAQGTLCAQLAISFSAERSAPDAAEQFFASFLGLSFDNEQPLAAARAIRRWNDAPGRTQEEVVTKLREAAAKARSEGK